MLPLKGIRVLDLTTLNGFATMELADYGAEVIKVERPGTGDGVREYPPFQEGVSLYHAFMDRGKKSITLDLKSAKGQEVFRKLVAKADVLVENFKVGTMEKMGLGYEALAEVNPKLVYAALTGFGSTGPYKDYIAFDTVIQAKTGIIDITGFPAPSKPTKIGAYIADHYSCTQLVAGINIALYHARATGVGQYVENSMFEALFSVTEDRIAIYDFDCKDTTRTGNAHPSINPYDVLKCKDGYVALGISTDGQWKKFCVEFGVADWADHPNYATNAKRGEHYFGDLRDKLEAHLVANFGKQEITDRCAAIKVPATGCNTIEEAINQEQIKCRDMVVSIQDQRVGSVKAVGKTIKFHDAEKNLPTHSAPLLGQHNQEVYGELYSSEEIAALCAQQII